MVPTEDASGTMGTPVPPMTGAGDEGGSGHGGGGGVVGAGHGGGDGGVCQSPGGSC